MQLGEQEQCRVNKLAHGFSTAAQDSNPGPLSRASEALPLNHSALYKSNTWTVRKCYVWSAMEVQYKAL